MFFLFSGDLGEKRGEGSSGCQRGLGLGQYNDLVLEYRPMGGEVRWGGPD